MSLRYFVITSTLILMIMVTSLLIGYRYVFSLPNIEQSIEDYQNRELLSIKIALDHEFVFLETLNYDYAVWDDSYEFLQKQDFNYINSNFADDTFKALKIDGVFIYDMNFNLVYSKMHNYIQVKDFETPEFNLRTHPKNKIILPLNYAIPKNDSSKRSGFLKTKHGPVMFASHMIRKTNNTGEQVGAMVFIRKLRPPFIEKLASVAQVDLTHFIPTNGEYPANLKKLTGSLQGGRIATQRQRALTDINNEPLMLIDIKHYHQKLPVLLDRDLLLTLLMFLLISLVGLFIINRYFIHPLIRGAEALNKMLLRNTLSPLKMSNQFLELQVLIKGFNALFMQISEKNKELERISKIDGLTHLFNRRAFDEIFEQQWSEAKNKRSTLTILLVDVDFFKQFNDVYGHQAGDTALQKVANTLNKTALLYQGVAARYGGEEFIILLNRLSDEQSAEVSNLLLSAVTDLQIDHIGSDIQNHLTISIGCVNINGNHIFKQNIQPKSAIKTADDSLYQAKNEGRNRVKFKSI